MPNSQKTAREIAEDLLERSGQGLIAGDFKSFADCFVLPKELETFEGRRVVKTEDEMESIFDDMRAYYGKIGMTHMDRRIVDAEFRNPTTIVSTHHSRIVADQELAQQPFDVLSVIELVDDVWRIRHCQYAIIDSEEHNKVLTGPDPVLVDRDGS